MKYIYTLSRTDVADALAQTIKEHLNADERVLWLLSGGSALATAVLVADQLSGTDTSKLAVSLVDERYGPLGHANENWQQLLDAGFTLPTAELYRPLVGKDRAVTTQAFSQWLQAHITGADYSVGLFGIGADGHTAGIKPGTLSTVASGWATDYESTDYERVTMTFEAIEHLSEGMIQAIGPDKAEVIAQLLHQDIARTEQPAQVLKSLKKSTLFTDYKETTI